MEEPCKGMTINGKGYHLERDIIWKGISFGKGYHLERDIIGKESRRLTSHHRAYEAS
jgi:hypothetical protein